ncbi:hypothetical protein Smp_198720 [Schistosoma mansoni]|nr:hypothetical protein Smp_198720 [Schistosoma mansoni]|eukprot:XP_018645822.1 hypothetical protein Smp_198720 [Schistosoma mansoni]
MKFVIIKFDLKASNIETGLYEKFGSAHNVYAKQ